MAHIIIKSAEQIEGIRQSSILAAQTLKYIAEYVVEGVSTAALDKKIDTYIRDHGALPAPLNYNGFPKSSCISLNEVVCHGIPNPKEILKNGDILNVDVTTILNGYFGDTSRMFAIGDIDENGLDGIQRASLKRVDTMNNDVDEKGFNAHQRSTVKHYD